MNAHQLPAGFRARPAAFADARSVADVISAVEREHGHGTVTTEATQQTDWGSLDLESESVLIEAADGTVVGYADVLNMSFVSANIYVYVAPEFTGRGLGTYLMGWGERWLLERIDEAPNGAEITVRQFVAVEDQAAQQLLQAQGYEHVRTTWVMRTILEGEPPAPAWPAGIQPAAFRPGLDDRDVFDTIEAAFADVWGRPSSNFERFQRMTRMHAVDADLWIVARTSDGQSVGTCLGEHSEGTGWISSVGVLRDYRGRGLGLALLHACFSAFYRRGVRDIRLSVDAESSTGAPRVYQRAGMTPMSTYLLHQKVLRPGASQSD